MARKPGNISRFLTNLKNSFFVAKQTSKYIGSDQFGNKYYEIVGDSNRNARGQRYIEERSGSSMQDIPDVPVEWDAWLRGRRKTPPTEEEIQRNYVKMIQKKMRAEHLEKKFSEAQETGSDQNSLTETIGPSHHKSTFPTYEEYEDTPGQKYNKEGNKIS